MVAVVASARRSVSVVAVIVRDDGRMLGIQRRDQQALGAARWRTPARGSDRGCRRGTIAEALPEVEEAAWPGADVRPGREGGAACLRRSGALHHADYDGYGSILSTLRGSTLTLAELITESLRQRLQPRPRKVFRLTVDRGTAALVR